MTNSKQVPAMMLFYRSLEIVYIGLENFVIGNTLEELFYTRAWPCLLADNE